MSVRFKRSMLAITHQSPDAVTSLILPMSLPYVAVPDEANTVWEALLSGSYDERVTEKGVRLQAKTSVDALRELRGVVDSCPGVFADSKDWYEFTAKNREGVDFVDMCPLTGHQMVNVQYKAIANSKISGAQAVLERIIRATDMVTGAYFADDEGIIVCLKPNAAQSSNLLDTYKSLVSLVVV